MPAATDAPPVTPPASVTIVDTPPPKPPPAPTSTIRVSDMPKSVDSPNPGKPGSAKERMFEKLRSKAVGATPPVSPETSKPDASTPSGDKTPGQATPPDPGAPDSKVTPASKDDPQPAAGTPPEDIKDGKTNPWKLVERYKSRAAELEKQVAEAKTTALADAQKKEYLDQIESLTKRRDELENEIRFVDYSKSEEFRNTYQKPYEEAWKSAAEELSEIIYTDPQTRQTRPATVDDISALINLPLAQAREIADAVFGKFADDVMGHRKEIRKLFEKQSAALKDAREKGAEREKQRVEMATKQTKDISDFLAKTWGEINKAAHADPKHGKWFVPTEGDQEGNQRLAKGFEMVDRAFSENPSDPGLTQEQRVEMMKRHAAVRNRAAAFGRLRGMYEKAQETIAALEKELNAFKSSTPTTGAGTAPTPAAAAPKSAREDVFAKLRALAK